MNTKPHISMGHDATTSYRRRGSESSDNSSGASVSNFRERFSSSSDSDKGRPNGQNPSRPSGTKLLELCTTPRRKEEVLELLTTVKTRPRTLAALFALSDADVSTDMPLEKSSTSTRLLDMVMENSGMGLAAGAYLSDTTDTVCAVGARYLFETLSGSVKLVPHFDLLLFKYVELASTGLLQEVENGGSRVMNPQLEERTVKLLRLLELILRRRSKHHCQLTPGVERFLLSCRMSCDAVQLAALHVVRSFVCPPSCFPTRSHFDLHLQIALTPVLNYSPGYRALAFSALAVALRYEPALARVRQNVPGTLNEILETAVKVMLWKTSWQHGFEKENYRTWGTPPLIPHDDAYTILSLLPLSYFVSKLRLHLETADSYEILEPLIALIVDRTAEPDPYWPTMLSALIKAGLIDYLMKIAVMTLPDQTSRSYRVVHASKRDAVTGVLRCFEQVPWKDIKHIKWHVFETLERLKEDEAQPLAVQDLAKAALATWDE
ncbi:hypothetical protein FRB96_008883 [Tulasnella sp. 330]|nr:hypothetical protein FRB96_008883 [Tulasnella sp. 330]